MYTRRSWLQTVLARGVGLLVVPELHADAKPVITIYKSPTCGCCTEWSKHLAANGFIVRVKDVDDVDPIKTKYGIPDAMASCHTAIVAGYVVEGHVPADVVQRLLREKPRAIGIAVPGMPMGSPGMEASGEHAGHKEPFTVFLLQRGGKTSVYAKR